MTIPSEEDRQYNPPKPAKDNILRQSAAHPGPQMSRRGVIKQTRRAKYQNSPRDCMSSLWFPWGSFKQKPGPFNNKLKKSAACPQRAECVDKERASSAMAGNSLAHAAATIFAKGFVHEGIEFVACEGERAPRRIPLVSLGLRSSARLRGASDKIIEHAQP